MIAAEASHGACDGFRRPCELIDCTKERADKENQKILRDIIRCGRHEVLQQGIQNGQTGKHDNKNGNNRCQNQGTHLSKCQHAKEDDGDQQNQYAKIHIPSSFPL